MNDLLDDFYIEQDFKLWFHVLRDIHSNDKPFSVLAKCLIQILRFILSVVYGHIAPFLNTCSQFPIWNMWFYKISIVNVL